MPVTPRGTRRSCKLAPPAPATSPSGSQQPVPPPAPRPPRPPPARPPVLSGAGAPRGGRGRQHRGPGVRLERPPTGGLCRNRPRQAGGRAVVAEFLYQVVRRRRVRPPRPVG